MGKLIKKIVGAISLVVVASAVFSFLSDGKIDLPLKKETPVLNSLTGLVGRDGPLLVVKIDDTRQAHPQVGLKSADIVYIEQVEGGLTRLAAVYSSTIPEVVGPVRSARVSDIELFAQYGKVGFSFSGAQRKFLPEIASANLADIGAMRYGPNFYSNDPNRIAPYAMMVQAKNLMSEALQRNPDIALSKPMGWTFSEESPPNQKFDSVEITWPASRYRANWSATEKRWLLYFGDEANLDASGYHLGPKNIIIQLSLIQFTKIESGE